MTSRVRPLAAYWQRVIANLPIRSTRSQRCSMAGLSERSVAVRDGVACWAEASATDVADSEAVVVGFGTRSSAVAGGIVSIASRPTAADAGNSTSEIKVLIVLAWCRWCVVDRWCSSGCDGSRFEPGRTLRSGCGRGVLQRQA